MQGAGGVPEIALGLALVVGLGVALGGECPVGDLGVAAAGVGVVEGGTGGRPLDEAPTGRVRGAATRVAQRAIALGVDDDGRHAAGNRLRGDRRLGDGLAGAGGADDKRVGPTTGAAELDRDRPAVAVCA